MRSAFSVAANSCFSFSTSFVLSLWACSRVAASSRSIAAECARSRFRVASMQRALACNDTTAAVFCAVHFAICALRCCSV
jgi:hypothetical protein